MALSDAKLRNLVNKKDDVVTLSHRDGLRVKRNKNGTLLWQYRCRVANKQVLMSLGFYPEIKISDAQDLLPLLKSWLHADLDPRIEYKRHLKGEAHSPTVKELANAWLNIKVPTLKPKTQTFYANNVSKWINKDLYDPQTKTKINLDTPADEMTPNNWIKYFDMVNKLGSAKLAGVMLVRLKTIIRWAAMRGEIKQANTIFNFQTKDVGEAATVGQRFLQFNEIALLWRQVEISKALPATKACLQLIFLTGARQSEVRLMHWEHLDFSNMIWTVPPENSKTNAAIRRPITKKMQEILESLSFIYGKRGPVIPGSSPKKPITTHAVNRYCTRMWSHLNDSHKVAKFIPHDARRSLSTLLSELEIPPHVTEKMLGHKMRGVMAVYNKHDYMRDQAKAYELYWQHIEQAINNLSE